MNSAVIIAASSGEGPSVKMKPALLVVILCGTARAHVPTQMTPRCASSSEKTEVDWAGPPSTANGFLAAIAMASDLAAAVSAPLPVPSKNSTAILRP